MASPFQAQVRVRKIWYIGLIIALFTVSLLWRRGVIDSLASRLSIREEDRGEVELVGSVVRLSLTGLRGLVICTLWNNAIDKQKKNQWNEMEVLVRSLTKLQPHFITPWIFQSWNLAYNVSVESDRVRDKYFYITRGIELLAQGERQNRNHPDLRWNIGFYTHHKIGKSDETNVKRSLFQLSLIPPNERHPARFRLPVEGGGTTFDYPEFAKFCREHPQLIRRLREAQAKENDAERNRQFKCLTPEDVVAFLEENYNVPGLYRVEPQSSFAVTWDPTRRDELLPAAARFPILPDAKREAPAYDPQALTNQSELDDGHDVFAVAHAWYAYAQEPCPKPGPLPGVPEEITDRARERKPRNMTLFLFRCYPGHAKRYSAERMQEEGWFDNEGFYVSDWFSDVDLKLADSVRNIGNGARQSSRLAWASAYEEWDRLGLDNRILFRDAASEQNMRELALRCLNRYRLPEYSPPPPARADEMPDQERREYEAARYMFELKFYRDLSQFMHHHGRAFVEKLPEAVACRKQFYAADREKSRGDMATALEYYRKPIVVPEVDKWKQERSPIEAWRDLILLTNKEYRRRDYNQETAAEFQTRYLILLNRVEGRKLKNDIVKASAVLPLLPKVDPDKFPAPILSGPFDVNDEDGEPLVPVAITQKVLDQMGYGRKPAAGPPPGAGEVKPKEIPR